MENEKCLQESIKNSINNGHSLKLSPFEIIKFFEPGSHIKEDELNLSINELIQIYPNFENKAEKNIYEVQKLMCIAAFGIRNLPIDCLLTLSRCISEQVDILPFLPSFPNQPAVNVLDFFLSTIEPNASNGWTDDEKQNHFTNFCSSNEKSMELLVDWRNQLKKYSECLDAFKKKNYSNLNQTQIDRIDTFKIRANTIIPNISKKIEEKRRISKKEKEDFNKFYEVISRDSKYSQLSAAEKKQKISKIYAETDEYVRKCITESVRNASEVSAPNLSTEVHPIVADLNRENVVVKNNEASQKHSNAPKNSSRSMSSSDLEVDDKKLETVNDSRVNSTAALKPAKNILTENKINSNISQPKGSTKRKIADRYRQSSVPVIKYSIFDEKPTSAKRNRKSTQRFEAYDAERSKRS